MAATLHTDRRILLVALLGMAVAAGAAWPARARAERTGSKAHSELANNKHASRASDRAKNKNKNQHRAGKRDRGAECVRLLDRLGVSYERVKRQGIDIGVRVRGDIGGIEYRGYQTEPLVLDCSLVVSLAVAGRYMSEHGIERVTYSSAFQRRKVRGSDRWSRHSFGLAIDIHTFVGEQAGTLRVKDDYEQGLGDTMDCVGQPLTQAGAVLRALGCQFERSELFYSVLTPDFDAAHYNHYHLEARPWAERKDRQSVKELVAQIAAAAAR